MQSVLWATGWRWKVSLSSSFTKIFSDLSSLFQACLICVSLWAWGMSSNISSREPILFSPLAVPALTAWFLEPAAPSLWEWRIPRDTLPPISPPLFLNLSFPLWSFFSFLSLFVLELEPLSRFSEPDEVETEDTEAEAVGSDELVRFNNLKRRVLVRHLHLLIW